MILVGLLVIFVDQRRIRELLMLRIPGKLIQRLMSVRRLKGMREIVRIFYRMTSKGESIKVIGYHVK